VSDSGPGVVVACPCGEVYELRPEYAGRLLECPACRHRLRAGPRPGAPRPPAPDLDPAFDRDVFLLNQRVFRIASEYEVWSEHGQSVLYVERPSYPLRTVVAYVLGAIAASIVFGWSEGVATGAGDPLAALLRLLGLGLSATTFVVVSMSARPVRHVGVWRDDSRARKLLGVRQDQRVAVLERTYTVTTPAGEPLARLRKVYVHNLVRKRWYVEAPSGERLAVAVEDSIVLSLLRRVLGAFFGLLRTNFVLVGVGGAVLGEFNRKFTLFDRYVLDLRADPDRSLDRRVALALGVMLDTGERR
jgi:hypothetical protein